MMVCGVFAALLERDAARRADGATNFLRSADYDSRKGLTQIDGLNMFRALSAGRRAPLYSTTRRIPNGSKR
jgi:hypothetical protein